MWEDNIKIDLKEMGGGVGPVAGFRGCSNEPPGSTKRTEFLD